MGDHRAVVGQIDIGYRLQLHGNARGRAQQQSADRLRIAAKRGLGAHRQIDHPPVFVDLGHPLARESRLDGVEDVPRREPIECKALEIDVHTDNRRAGLVFDAHVPRPGQGFHHGGDPVGRGVQGVQVLAEDAYLHGSRRLQAVLSGVKTRSDSRAEARKALQAVEHQIGESPLRGGPEARRQLQIEDTAFGSPTVLSRGVAADALADRVHAGERLQRGGDARAIVPHHRDRRGRRRAHLSHEMAVAHARQQFEAVDTEGADRQDHERSRADQDRQRPRAQAREPSGVDVFQALPGPGLGRRRDVLKEEQAKRGRHRDGDDQRRQRGGYDGDGQRSQQRPERPSQHQDRQERHDHREGGVNHRPAHLQRGGQHGFQARCVPGFGAPQPRQHILHIDHRVVDHHPQPDGQPAEGHRVQCPAEHFQCQDGREQRHRNADQRDQRRAWVAHEERQHDRDERRADRKVPCDAAHGRRRESRRPVKVGPDGDPLRGEGGPERGKSLLDGVRGFKRVGFVLLGDVDQNAGLAHDEGVAGSRRRRLHDVRHVVDAHRSAARILDLAGADIVGGQGLAMRLDQHALSIRVDEAGPGYARRPLHGLQDIEETQIGVRQVARPGAHLDAPGLAAVHRDPGDAGGAEQARPDGPLHHIAQGHGVQLVAGEPDLQHLRVARCQRGDARR